MSQNIRIKSIRLEGFGCFGPEPREFEFDPSSTNCVIGPNEAGKTTLLRAIFCLLFGIYNFEDRSRFRPWDARANYTGSLTLDVDGQWIRFTHDFDKSLALIEKLDSAGEVKETIFNGPIGKTESRAEARAYRKKLQKLLGLASPDFLVNSLFIQQSQLDVQIGDEVHRIISGMGQGDINDVQSRLEEQYTNLTDYNRFTKRPLKDREIEKVERRLHDRKEALNRISADSQRRDHYIQQISQVEARMQKSRQALEKVRAQFEAFDRLYRQSDKKQALLEKLTALRAEEEKRNEREREIQELKESAHHTYPQFVDAPEDLGNRFERVIQLQTQFKQLDEQKQKTRETIESQRRRIAEIESVCREEFESFLHFDDDFPARVEQYYKLNNELDEIGETVYKIDEDLAEIEAQIEEFGRLKQLDDKFPEQWHRARTILAEKQPMEEQLETDKKIQARRRNRNNFFSVVIPLLCILIGVLGFIYVGPDHYAAYVILVVLTVFGIGVSFFLQSSNSRSTVELYQSEFLNRLSTLSQELSELFEKWGTTEINLEDDRDLQEFHELQELRDKRRRLLERRAQYEPTVIDDQDSQEVEPRRVRIEKSLNEYGEAYEPFLERPLEEVLTQWRNYQALRDEQRKLRALIEEAEQSDQSEYRKLQENLEHESRALKPFLVNGDAEASRQQYIAYCDQTGKARILEEQLQHVRTRDEIRNDLVQQEAEYNRIGQEMDSILENLPGLRPLADHPAELSDKISEAHDKQKRLAQSVQDLQEELFNLKSEVAAIHIEGGEGIEVLKEGIAEDKKQLKRLKRHCRALEIALETLEECETDFQMVHMERLAEASTNYFSGITNGAYRSVKFAGDFTPEVTNPDFPGISLDHLSRGTYDQLNLSIRFALARELAGDVCWPFLLDDPFVHCDASRLQNIRQTLARLSSEHQIILFAHDPEYWSWGTTIEL